MDFQPPIQMVIIDIPDLQLLLAGGGDGILLRRHVLLHCGPFDAPQLYLLCSDGLGYRVQVHHRKIISIVTWICLGDKMAKDLVLLCGENHYIGCYFLRNLCPQLFCPFRNCPVDQVHSIAQTHRCD